jgi:hypothetical protein
MFVAMNLEAESGQFFGSTGDDPFGWIPIGST